MKHRPWQIIILGIFHLIEPICKIMTQSLFLKVPVKNIISFIGYNIGDPQTLAYVFLFPLAGIGLISFKFWGILLFFGAEICSFILNLSYMHHLYLSGKITFLAFLLFVYVLNFLVVIYFLIPSVRKIYFYSRYRWWECKERFLLSLEGEFSLPCYKEKAPFQIKNISASGALICFSKNLPIGQQVKLFFFYEDLKFELGGVVAHILHGSQEKGAFSEKKFGVQFSPLSLKDRFYLRKLVYALKKNKTPRVHQVSGPWKTFKSFLRDVYVNRHIPIPDLN